MLYLSSITFVTEQEVQKSQHLHAVGSLCPWRRLLGCSGVPMRCFLPGGTCPDLGVSGALGVGRVWWGPGGHRGDQGCCWGSCSCRGWWGTPQEEEDDDEEAALGAPLGWAAQRFLCPGGESSRRLILISASSTEGIPFSLDAGVLLVFLAGWVQGWVGVGVTWTVSLFQDEKKPSKDYKC